MAHIHEAYLVFSIILCLLDADETNSFITETDVSRHVTLYSARASTVTES